MKKSDRLAILCHLKADHTHDIIPDTDMVMAHPLARTVPQVAREGIHAMRLAIVIVSRPSVETGCR